MDSISSVDISLAGTIDRQKAESIVAKIRSAIQNGIKHINVVCESNTDVVSAEFLTFLAAASKHLKAEQGALILKNPNGRMRTMLEVSKLSDVIEQSSGSEDHE